MAWTQPRTWVAGELVTAAIMNTHVRDELLAIAEGTVALDAVTLDGKTMAPAVAPSGDGRIYFDATVDLFKASVDGGAYRPLSAGSVWPLGGSATFRQTNGAFTVIQYVEVMKPSNALSGKVHAMARVDGGTGELRLYNVTDSAVVGSAWDVTATTMSLVESGMLTLTADKEYRLETKRGSTWVIVYGAKFVETV